MQRLLYISDSNIEPNKGVVASHLVKCAKTKNEQLGITGALISTYQHFVQVLEGSPEAIEILMASIQNDQRHSNLVIVYKSGIAHRQFPHMQVAYEGPSLYVTGHVTRVLQASSEFRRHRAARWLTDLAREFVTIRTDLKVQSIRTLGGCYAV